MLLYLLPWVFFHFIFLQKLGHPSLCHELCGFKLFSVILVQAYITL